MSDTALKIEGLTKKFGGLVAVNNLDMEIKKERINLSFHNFIILF